MLNLSRVVLKAAKKVSSESFISVFDTEGKSVAGIFNTSDKRVKYLKTVSLFEAKTFEKPCPWRKTLPNESVILKQTKNYGFSGLNKTSIFFPRSSCQFKDQLE